MPVSVNTETWTASPQGALAVQGGWAAEGQPSEVRAHMPAVPVGPLAFVLFIQEFIEMAASNER